MNIKEKDCIQTLFFLLLHLLHPNFIVSVRKKYFFMVWLYGSSNSLANSLNCRHKKAGNLPGSCSWLGVDYADLWKGTTLLATCPKRISSSFWLHASSADRFSGM